ncbi:MAG: MaoC family dehydratase [Hyphomicrobiaceae bacterium]
MTSPPIIKHFYEDLVVGTTVQLGSSTVSKQEIIAYAQAFDPQPLHLDEEAAKASMIGRLCASGWHSCAILMRLLCDSFLLEAASLGSPGIEEVKFLKPVFPDDRLSLRYTCNSKRPLASRPNVGLARLLFEMTNQAGDVVLTWDCNQLMGMRHATVEGARP